MRHDWKAVHAERFAPIAGGQIDSTVCRGRVIIRLVDEWLGSWDQPVASQRGLNAEGTNVRTQS